MIQLAQLRLQQSCLLLRQHTARNRPQSLTSCSSSSKNAIKTQQTAVDENSRKVVHGCP